MARASGIIADPAFQDRLAAASINVTALSALFSHAVELTNQQHSPGPELSVIKIFGSELLQALNELLVEAAGGHAPTREADRDEFRRGGRRSAVPAVAARDHLRRLIGNPAQRPRPPRAEPAELTRMPDAMDLHLTSEQTLLRDSAAKFIDGGGAEGSARISRAGSELRAGAAAAGGRARLARHPGAEFRRWPWSRPHRARAGARAGRAGTRLRADRVCGDLGGRAGAGARAASDAGTGDDGAALVVPALQESGYGDDPLAPRTRAAGSAGALRLTGQKMFVCADGADGFLVSASGRDGPVLCYVARDAPGCTLTTTQTVDGRKLATLSLADAPADLIPPHPVVAQRGRGAPRSCADGDGVRIAGRHGEGAGDRRSTTCASASSSGS